MCSCCPRSLTAAELEAQRTVCVACEARIRVAIDALVELWPRLADRIAPGSGPTKEPDTPRPPGPVAAPAPVNLEALSLSSGEVTRILHAHEVAWCEALGKTATPPTGSAGLQLGGVVAFLRLNLTWACTGGTDRVDALDRDLRKLVRRVRSVVEGFRAAPRALAVPCPLPTSDGDGDGPPCGGELVYEPMESKIRCRGCRRTVGHTRWAELAARAGLIPAPLPKAS